MGSEGPEGPEGSGLTNAVSLANREERRFLDLSPQPVGYTPARTLTTIE